MFGRKTYLWLAISWYFLIWNIASTHANNDYVCSYATTVCTNVVCDATWDANGVKHCYWTVTDYTRYGNTRVGCPSQTAPIGSETFRINEGFNFGDLATNVQTCEIVYRDNQAPAASATIDDVKQNQKVWVQNLPAGCACFGSGCTPKCTGTGDLYAMVKVSESVTTKCNDGWNVWDSINNKYGNSGCKLPLTAPFGITTGQNFTVTVQDLAGNTATCSRNGTCSNTTYCTANPTSFGCKKACYLSGVEDPNGCNPKCNMSNGSTCLNDNTAPSGQIAYGPATCTNQDVTVTNTCIADTGNPDVSGCRPAPEDKWVLIVTNNNNGTLGVADNAGNNTDITWTVDWIDKTVPNNIAFTLPDQRADINGQFQISATDTTAPSALCSNNLAYTVTITGPESKVINGVTQNDGSLSTGPLGLTKIGNYTFDIQIRDDAGNIANQTFTYTIYPADVNASNSNIVLNTATTNGSKYANNSDAYTYTVTLKDRYNNPVYGKNILFVNQEDALTLKTDMRDFSAPTGNDAINEVIGGATDLNGITTFTVNSVAPGEYNEKFHFRVAEWDGVYVDAGTNFDFYLNTANKNLFRKPFSGGLDIIDASGNPTDFRVGVLQPLKLDVKPLSTLITNAITNLTDSLVSLEPSKYKIQTKSTVTATETHFNLNWIIEEIIGGQIGIITKPVIEYDLGGKHVIYHLTESDVDFTTNKIELLSGKFSGLGTEGTTQWDGKLEQSGKKVNFSDISKFEQRTMIRKKATELIRGLTDGQTVNGVHYEEGDITISGDSFTYETLIVKNGNVIINGNLNLNHKKLGVIVLKDDQADSSLGNVYVTPEVGYIEATIYADGWIIAAATDGTPFLTDSITRTYSLYRQLVIKGSLFTRNTIGGAIGDAGTYILPGGSTTSDFDLALTYDLNFVRANNIGWDNASWTKLYNEGNTDSVVIIYNPDNQSNPPKGFSTK